MKPRETFTVRQITEGKDEVCSSILRSLPKWFGLEQAIVDYTQAAKRLPMFVVDVDGHIEGFASLEFLNPYTAEVHVMAVHEPFHRSGVGQVLVSACEGHARTQGAEFLMVKTLGPSKPNEEYSHTLKFYLGVGFRPIEEFKNLWKGNPCLLMMKKLDKALAGQLHHVELYVSDLRRSMEFWGWLLTQLGYTRFQAWEQGESWKLGTTYLVFVQAEPDHLDVPYHRKRTGLNHLALHAESRDQVDQFKAALADRGVKLLYSDKHPHRDGKSYALYFEDPDRIKVELVAP